MNNHIVYLDDFFSCLESSGIDTSKINIVENYNEEELD